MIRLEFAPTDLAGVRFAHSPLAEVAASSVALRKPDQFWMYASWRAQVQPAVRASRLSTFLTVMAGPNGWMPDFLTPVPPTATATPLPLAQPTQPPAPTAAPTATATDPTPG